MELIYQLKHFLYHYEDRNFFLFYLFFLLAYVHYEKFHIDDQYVHLSNQNLKRRPNINQEKQEW